MARIDRRILLWGMVACLVALAAALSWATIYDAYTHFPAGSSPKLPQAKLPEPTLPPIRPSDPSRGGAPGKAIQIVEFADYSCLYCRLMEFELKQVFQDQPDAQRLVWRDLPVPSERPDGIMAAVAARCAGEQGKFWEMHDALFTSPTLDVKALQSLAVGLRLNASAFDLCLTSGKQLSAVQADLATAQLHNLAGAPTLFIGKEVLSGQYTAQEIKDAVRRASLLKQ